MIAVEVNPETGQFDIAFDGGLVEDNSFIPDILISFFTDRRAPDFVKLALEDRRGWWADSSWGSRVWLEMQAPLTREALTRIRKATEECFAWMVEEEIVQSIIVTAERDTRSSVKLSIAMEKADGQRWQVAWKLTAEKVVEFAVQSPNA